MKAATLVQIKKALKDLDEEALLNHCVRLAKYKKDNKELLTYLLFEAADEQGYINLIKEEIDLGIEDINTSHSYYAKKGVRKILRGLNKFIRYSGNKQTEVELLIYFCQSLKGSRVNIKQNRVIQNVYETQVKKIHKALEKLHEDIQFDYQEQIRSL